MSSPVTSGTIDTPPDLAAELNGRLRTKGERATCLELQVCRQTTSRLAAGLPVRRGTIAHVRQRLAELAADATPADGAA